MVKPGCYAHFKGKKYEVINVATHTETEEVMVVYRELYTDEPLFVRPLAMFLEKVDSVTPQARFDYVGTGHDYHYKIIGFCPRTDLSMGRWGFHVELDFDFAVRLHMFKLKAAEQRELRKRFRAIAMTISAKQYPLFEDYPRVSFLDDSMLISNIAVPGDACGLDIDDSREIRSRERHRLSVVQYHPHNVDVMVQAVQLLAVFAEWYLVAAATVGRSITPLDEEIEVGRDDDAEPE